MAYKVRFSVDGSTKSISDLAGVEFGDDYLRCTGEVDGEERLVAAIPLEAVEYVVEESADPVEDRDEVPVREPGDIVGTATVSADPSTAGATSTHTVTLQVVDGIDTFDWFRVDYGAKEGEAEISNVSRNDIKRFGVDTDGDGDIEKSLLTDDWEVTHGGSGHTLRIRNEEWEGELSTGDVIILEVDDVKNPETSATYDAEVILNGHQTAVTSFGVAEADEGND